MDSPDPSDSESEMSRDIFSAASSHTSFSDAMSISSGHSVHSMSSSTRANAFRRQYGRGLNNYSEIYQLPADDDELERLDKQHAIFKVIFGKYPPPIYQVLADPGPGGEVVTCLDLGCGSGSWILEVAHDFPHCSCVAVDLAPLQVTSMPPNCRSEVDDINLGLHHFYGDFNVVHTRFICSGMKDYASLIDQCSQALRPGGLLQCSEFDFRIYTADYRPVTPHEPVLQPPWFPRWMTLCSIAVLRRGGEAHAANDLNRWISQHAAFEDVHHRLVYAPTSPFVPPNAPGAQFWNHVGNSMREDVIEFLRSARPLLLGHGYPQSLVDELERRAEIELIEANPPYYIRIESVYARKRR